MIQHREPVEGAAAPRPRAARAPLAVAAATLLAAAAWGQTQLVNPGFEDGGGSLAGWQVFGNSTGNVTVDGATPRSGSWAASISGPPTAPGATSYSGLVQGVSTPPGVVWTVSAYCRHNSGALLEEDNRLVMKIEYYRRFGGAYGSRDLISETEVTALDARTPPDVWRPVSLGVYAPPDAVEVRIAFVLVRHGTAGGTALVDDVSLTATDGRLVAPEGKAWWLLWGDEFDGGAVDTTKWRVLDAHLIKNGELQYYDPEDVYLENGCLVLRSRHHDPPVVRPHPEGGEAEFAYTSGLVETADRFAHAYGLIEIRAKLPSTQGIWPAHWMLGDRYEEIGWPRCGEIDIMESVGFDPDTVFFSRHWGDPYASQGASYSGPVFADDFHTFALHWTPERMAWYVDGTLRYLTSTSDAGDTFRQPFYLILNTAVGGYWPGYPDSRSVFPQYHRIDYVRWYVEAEPGDSDRDGDVDIHDLVALARCFSGDGVPWDDPSCRFFDADADADVDCGDLSAFSEVWTGPVPAVPRLAPCGMPAPRLPVGRAR